MVGVHRRLELLLLLKEIGPALLAAEKEAPRRARGGAIRRVGRASVRHQSASYPLFLAASRASRAPPGSCTAAAQQASKTGQ